MHKFNLLNVNLRLFDGAAGAGGAGTASAGTTGTSGAVTAEGNSIGTTTVKPSGRSHRSRTGDLSNVVYGNGDNTGSAAEGTGKPTVSPEEKRKAFEELINGEYAEEFKERASNAVKKRVDQLNGQNAQLQAQLQAQQKIIDMSMARYDIPNNDIGELTKQMENDDEYWEELADRSGSGLTGQQYKYQKQLEQENQRARDYAQFRADNLRKEQIRQNIVQQALAYKQANPESNFNLMQELDNPKFATLVGRGVDIATAYEVTHLQEIKNSAAKTAAQQAESNTIAQLNRKASRPAESGTSSSGGGAVFKNDVNALTKADRAEIARRVKRGAHIGF